ncbi:MAG: acetyl-CoA carboxylase carboxyltransferase subunit alpha [Actinobacteria bacterium]|nr:acetyl-CoA carboxylase carboxyltransferase subunit alpha [Actinomycetota bacterium]
MKRFAFDFENELINLESEIDRLKSIKQLSKEDSRKLEELEKIYSEVYRKTYSNLTPWNRVQLARHPYRPTSLFYINRLFKGLQEIKADRRYPDDLSLVCFIGEYKGKKTAIAGIEKGADSRERQKRRFGMPLPEGYYKFIRLLEIAEQLKIPVITFVDTPGAYPGIEAEEKGQALAIARSIQKMLFVKVPTVSFVIGEGGSGGAIALACADRIYVLENAYYSVISPEGCASILFHDEKRAPEAAELLKLTADDLFKLKLIHGIVKEPLGSAYRHPEETLRNIDKTLENALQEISSKDVEQLLKERHQFFINIDRNINNLVK